MRVTDTWLRTAVTQNRGKERYRVTVDRGPGRGGSLMVTVYADGTAAFSVRYTRPTGARVFLPLGPYGDAGLSLAEACDAHDEALKLLAKGMDPIEEHERRQIEAERRRLERAAADTVASLAEQFVHRRLRAERWDATARAWVRDRASIKARKRPEVAAALLGYGDGPPAARRGKSKPVPTLVSELGAAKARDVTRRQLITFLDSIVERGSPVTANRVHALLAQMFDWAAAKDMIPASPMAGVERPGGDEQPRDRVLTAEEIRAFWEKLDTAEMDELTRLALKLLLVTAQRRGEITFAKWSHFDLEGKLWTIPVELLKSSHSRRSKPEPHKVPLSPLALEILGKLKALSRTSPYVLPARGDHKKAAPYSERALSRAVRENADHFGISHFTPHDLRRTAASFMTKLKVPRLHVEKVLNHSTGDIAEVYDRHDYLPEKCDALERWSAYLTEILEGREKHKAISLAKRA